MARCTDGHATGTLHINSSAHRYVKRQWDFVHIDDTVAVDVVLLQLVDDKGTEGLYLLLVVGRKLLG